jgi:hypothetical protein
MKIHVFLRRRGRDAKYALKTHGLWDNNVVRIECNRASCDSWLSQVPHKIQTCHRALQILKPVDSYLTSFEIECGIDLHKNYHKYCSRAQHIKQIK